MIVTAISCKKEKVIESKMQAVKSDLYQPTPAGAILDMEIDNNNHFYFAVRSFYGGNSYLYRKMTENSEFEVIDDNFVETGNMIFDKKNNLWAITNYGLVLRKNNKCDTIIKLDYSKGEGSFGCLAVDKDNNIWVGGWLTGLYKIDELLNITRYTTENSELKSNNISRMYIDESNTIWISLDSSNSANEILRITGKEWRAFGANNTKYNSIWSLAVDKNDNLWVGTQWNDINESLIKFDGTNWVPVTPMNDKKEIITGTVSYLFSDSNRIYVAIQSKAEPYSMQLLTFDGVNWNKIYGLPESDIIIGGFRTDTYNQVVWIRTSDGIYKLNL
jgi:ligand-binding sensor domain-containing protein